MSVLLWCSRLKKTFVVTERFHDDKWKVANMCFQLCTKVYMGEWLVFAQWKVAQWGHGIPRLRLKSHRASHNLMLTNVTPSDNARLFQKLINLITSPCCFQAMFGRSLRQSKIPAVFYIFCRTRIQNKSFTHFLYFVSVRCRFAEIICTFENVFLFNLKISLVHKDCSFNDYNEKPSVKVQIFLHSDSEESKNDIFF